MLAALEPVVVFESAFESALAALEVARAPESVMAALGAVQAFESVVLALESAPVSASGSGGLAFELVAAWVLVSVPALEWAASGLARVRALGRAVAALELAPESDSAMTSTEVSDAVSEQGRRAQ